MHLIGIHMVSNYQSKEKKNIHHHQQKKIRGMVNPREPGIHDAETWSEVKASKPKHHINIKPEMHMALNNIELTKYCCPM